MGKSKDVTINDAVLIKDDIKVLGNRQGLGKILQLIKGAYLIIRGAKLKMMIIITHCH